MRSIFHRYFSMTAMLIFFSFTILGVFFLAAVGKTVSEQRLETLRRCAASLASGAQSVVQGGVAVPDASFGQTLAVLSDALEAHVMLCDPTGRILICSDSPGSGHVGERIPDVLLTNALQGKDGTYRQLEGFSDGARTIANGLVRQDGMIYGIVLISSSPSFEQTVLGVYARTYMISSVIVLLVAVFSIYGTSRIIARPLRDMAYTAQDFAQGNFAARVTRWIGREDEVGELGSAFNAMADALSKQEELRRGFIANVSHELKTPMTIIAGYIGGLLDGTIPPEREAETLTLVQGEILRLSRMVSSMTQISVLQSSPEEVQLQAFDLCDMAMRIILGMEQRVNDKGIQVELILPEQQVAYVLSEPDGMTQVLTNLLDNAVKFSDEGGTLTMSITRRSGQYIVSVQNQGPTIPPEDIPYIFERFHKTDRSRSQDRSGLGLGLYLVKNILGAQKVDIFVTSSDGLTEFTFALPEAKTLPKAAEKSGEEPEPPQAPQ